MNGKKEGIMKALQFESALIGSVYPKDFTLPDYVRNADRAFSREKTLEVLLREEYGKIDEEGVSVEVKDVTDGTSDFCRGYSVCGKAKHSALEFTVVKAGERATFVLDLFVPVRERNFPVIVQLDFMKDLPTKYCPIEELVDRGAAIAHLYYGEIATDDGDFSVGLARLFCKEKSPGKIALWAYGARLAARHLKESGPAQADKIYVAGHSRLGKAAMLACAEDEIFAGCMVNNSGCCGAAISRGKKGETVKKINEVFGYWFTPRFARYGDKEFEMPFDQHFLAACVAPRKLLIVAASEDEWADTDAQYLCAEAASTVYRERNAAGLAPLGRGISVGERNTGGQIGFFSRKGPHFFSREDWNFYLDCIGLK